MLAATRNGEWHAAALGLDEVLAYRELGRHLSTPWRVVIAGPANVGKSSLLNAIAGFQRAIVSPLPGTTRDVVTLTTAVDGWPVQLADTAGFRVPEGPIEAAGIELATSAIAAADLLIRVRDATAIGMGNERSPTSAGAGDHRPIEVLNKIDLIPATNRDALRSSRASGAPPILTSAVTSEGVSQLIAAIGQALVPRAPTPGTAVPFTPEQLASLELARDAVARRDAAAARQAMQSLLAR
jgi:tRNA modification GTPase